MQEDELELLRRWRDGDKAAGNRLFERHFGGLYRFFINKVSGEVEELIQKTALACLEGRDRIRGETDGSFRAYLYGAARYVLYGHYRERARDNFDPLETSVEDLAPGLSQQVAAAHDSSRLKAALRRLPLEQQIVLELHYWEHMSHRELAAVLGVTVGSVKGRIKSAQRAIRGKMDELARGPGEAQSSVT